MHISLTGTWMGAWEYQVVGFLLQAGNVHVACMFRYAK